MKHVRGILRPESLTKVLEVLKESKVARFYVSRTKALGAGVDPEAYQVATDEGGAYSEKIVVEFLCPADRVDGLLDTLRGAARTGHRGDGVIVVSDAVDVVNVRTGDRGPIALL